MLAWLSLALAAPLPAPPPEAPSVQWAVREATILGALDREIILRVLRVHDAAVAPCAASNPVEVTASFVIGKVGQTEHVDVRGSEAAAACVTEVLEAVVFPACKGGGIVIVRDLPVRAGRSSSGE